jgi:hypothetical protein
MENHIGALQALAGSGTWVVHSARRAVLHQRISSRPAELPERIYLRTKANNMD